MRSPVAARNHVPQSVFPYKPYDTTGRIYSRSCGTSRPHDIPYDGGSARCSVSNIHPRPLDMQFLRSGSGCFVLWKSVQSCYKAVFPTRSPAHFLSNKWKPLPSSHKRPGPKTRRYKHTLRYHPSSLRQCTDILLMCFEYFAGTIPAKAIHIQM